MTGPSILNQATELVRVDTLHQHPDNPNVGDRDAIRESIMEHGFYGTVLVQRATRRILYGWHRTDVFRELGGVEVPVTWVDVDDDRALRIVLADNEIGRRGRYDEMKLLGVLRGLAEDDRGLAGSGFADEDLSDLVARLERAEPAARDYTPDPDRKEKFQPDATRLRAARRLLVLDLAVDRFAWLVEQLSIVEERERVDTHDAAVLLLAARYTGAEIPRADDGLDEVDR